MFRLLPILVLSVAIIGLLAANVVVVAVRQAERSTGVAEEPADRTPTPDPTPAPSPTPTPTPTAPTPAPDVGTQTPAPERDDAEAEPARRDDGRVSPGERDDRADDRDDQLDRDDRDRTDELARDEPRDGPLPDTGGTPVLTGLLLALGGVAAYLTRLALRREAR